MNIPGYDAWRLRGPDDDRCPECNGYERLECETCDGHGHVLDGIDCAICEGTGFVQCLACHVEEPDGDYEYERRRALVEAWGKVKEGGGHSNMVSVAVQPKLFHVERGGGSWMVIILGLRIHRKRSYGGIFA